MTDKDFWTLICRGLLMVVHAIIKRYELNIKVPE